MANALATLKSGVLESRGVPCGRPEQRVIPGSHKGCPYDLVHENLVMPKRYAFAITIEAARPVRH